MASLKTKFLVLFYIYKLIDMCYSICSAGEYLSNTSFCQTCPGGSYMEDSNHTNIHCITCTADDYDHTIVQYPCNTTHDTGYVCVVGRFNSNGKPFNCAVCRDCQNDRKFEVRPCTQTNDTIFCPKPDMTLVEAGNKTCLMANATDTKFCCIAKVDPSNTSPHAGALDKPTATIPATTEVPQPRLTSSLVDERNIKSSDGQCGLDVGAISGIASLVVIVGIAIVGALYCKKQRKKRTRSKGVEFEMIITSNDYNTFMDKDKKLNVN